MTLRDLETLALGISLGAVITGLALIGSMAGGII